MGQVDPLNVLQVDLRHRVDATQIMETIGDEGLLRELDEVTFCHPHIGSENIQKNSALVAHFFNSARQLQPKVIQISLLDSQYERWDVQRVANMNQLIHFETCEIHRQLYELGYETRRH